jgi:hypothetical protein
VSIADRVDCDETEEVCRNGECQSAEVVDPGGAPSDCEPGAKSCDGNVVSECNGDGSALVATGPDCGEDGQVCFDGNCSVRVCNAALECHNGASYACADNGTRLELATTCGSDTRTYCSPLTGHCLEYVCEPGSAVCQGNTATRCNDEGSGPNEDGIDCDPATKGCWDGGCLPKVCTALFVCDGAELLRCEKNGTNLTHEATCQAGTACSADVGACTPEACEPNHPECRNTVATSCNVDGIGFVDGGVDCAGQGQACAAGACVPQVCEPSATFCAAKELRVCDAGGASFSVADTCEESEACRADLQGCVPKICEPGAPACVGNLLTSCREDGTGLEQGGLDCAVAGQVCDHAACVPRVCEPSLAFCQGDNVFLCNASGSASAPFFVCDAGKPCQGAAGVAHCGA